MSDRMKKASIGKGKISSKIMGSIVSINLVSLVVIISTVVFLLTNNVGHEAKKMATQEVKMSVNEYEQSFSNVESAVSIIVSEIKGEFDVDKAKRDKSYRAEFKKTLDGRMKAISENTDVTKSVYVYLNTELFKEVVGVWYVRGDDGKGVLQHEFEYDYFKDKNQLWYFDPINGKSLWTFPYISQGVDVITSFVTPIEIDGEVIGMVGMDLYLNDIAETLSQKKLFETGYLYMMDSEGNIIVHPSLEFGSNITEAGDTQFMLDEMNTSEDGFIAYDGSDGKGIITAFDHLNNGWVVSSRIPESEVLKLVRGLIYLLLGLTLTSLIVSVIVSQIMGKRITRPIHKIVDAMVKLKDGDFTTLVEVNTNDETQLLANGLNEMAGSVKELIVQAKYVSKDMVDAAQNLASMAEETNATVDMVAVTIEEISKGTSETANDAEKGALVAAQIRDQFVVLMENSTEMSNNAESAIEVNKVGFKALETLRAKSKESDKSNVRVKDAVYSLDSKSGDITEIISTISSIAEQTNLLALNASIEAARAGDAGRGFAVVADEIRKLAESSNEAADEIRNIIVDIQNVSKDAVTVMDEVSVMGTQQNKALVDVNESFEMIFKAVENISGQIELVTHELEDLDNSKNELLNSVTNISAISEETAASTEQVEQSMDEQTKAVEQVAVSAERLNELSTDLNSKIDMFSV